jgi:hypothetical protein
VANFLFLRFLAIEPVRLVPRPNIALEPTAASGLRRLAVPSSLRSSAAAQRKRYAVGHLRIE